MSLVTSQNNDLPKLSILYKRGSLKKIAIPIKKKKRLAGKFFARKLSQVNRQVNVQRVRETKHAGTHADSQSGALPVP